MVFCPKNSASSWFGWRFCHHPQTRWAVLSTTVTVTEATVTWVRKHREKQMLCSWNAALPVHWKYSVEVYTISQNMSWNILIDVGNIMDYVLTPALEGSENYAHWRGGGSEAPLGSQKLRGLGKRPLGGWWGRWWSTLWPNFVDLGQYLQGQTRL